MAAGLSRSTRLVPWNMGIRRQDLAIAHRVVDDPPDGMLGGPRRDDHLERAIVDMASVPDRARSYRRG